MAEELADTNAGAAPGEAPDYLRLNVRDSVRESIKEIEGRDARAALAAREKPRTETEPKPKEGDSTEGRQRDEHGRFVGKPGEQPPVDTQPKGADTTAAQTTEVPGATTPPPAAAATTALTAPSSWSKEKHALFAAAPRELQEQILLREAQSQEGVAQLKRNVEEIDVAIAPYRHMIQQYGQTPGQTIRQLFEWNTALAGPYKEQAFAQLAQQFRIDLSRLAPQAAPQAAAQGGQQGVPNQAAQQIEAWQRGIETYLMSQQQQAQMREVQRASAEVQAWARDKPHFEAVRGIMQELVGIDQTSINQGLQPRHGIVKADGSVDLDRAYKKAIALDDSLSEQVRNEELAQREAKARAEAEAALKAKAAKDREEAERAKKAGASLKPGSVTSPTGKAQAQVPAGEKVRETLLRSIREARGS